MTWSLSVQTHVGTLALDVEMAGTHRPVALIGPNGSGKTTLLRIIAGALPAAVGSLTVKGECWWDSASGTCWPPEDRSVGYLPQGYGLFPHLSVLDNVSFGLSTGGARLPRPTREDRARAALDDVGCGHLASRRPASLSGGEQQRVALARALVMSPAILLLDEPMAALDAPNRRGVRALLADHLRRVDRPTIVVTHDIRDVVALDAELVVLDRGRVVQAGDLNDIRSGPANAFMQEFLG